MFRKHTIKSRIIPLPSSAVEFLLVPVPQAGRVSARSPHNRLLFFFRGTACFLLQLCPTATSATKAITLMARRTTRKILLSNRQRLSKQALSSNPRSFQRQSNKFVVSLPFVLAHSQIQTAFVLCLLRPLQWCHLEALGQLGGNVFPKLNWSCPQANAIFWLENHFALLTQAVEFPGCSVDSHRTHTCLPELG